MLAATGAVAQYDDVYYDPSRGSTSPRAPRVGNNRPAPSSSYEPSTYGYNDYDNDDYNDDQYAYEDDYDYYYTSRLRRFHRPYRGFDFFDPVYVDLAYYDPFFQPGLTVLIYDAPFNYVGFRSWRRWNRWNFGFSPWGWNNFGWNSWGYNPWGWNNFGWNRWNNFGWNNWNNFGWNRWNTWSNFYCPPTWGNGIVYNNVNNVFINNNRGGGFQDNNRYYGPRRSGSGIGPEPGLTPRPAPGVNQPGGREEVERVRERQFPTDRYAPTPGGNPGNPSEVRPGVESGGRLPSTPRPQNPTPAPGALPNDEAAPTPGYNDGGRRLSPAPSNGVERSRPVPGNVEPAPYIDRNRPYDYDRSRSTTPPPANVEGDRPRSNVPERTAPRPSERNYDNYERPRSSTPPSEGYRPRTASPERTPNTYERSRPSTSPSNEGYRPRSTPAPQRSPGNSGGYNSAPRSNNSGSGSGARSNNSGNAAPRSSAPSNSGGSGGRNRQ